MLTLGYFGKFPAAYKNREKSVKDVVFTKIVVNPDTDKNINIDSSTGKYSQQIIIYDETIHLNSPCKVYCSCESFKFEFANAVFRAGSLNSPLEFVRSIIKRPKEKNEFNIASGCKHLVALSRQALKIKINKGD